MKIVFTTTLDVNVTKELLYCFIWSTAWYGAETQKNRVDLKLRTYLEKNNLNLEEEKDLEMWLENIRTDFGRR